LAPSLQALGEGEGEGEREGEGGFFKASTFHIRIKEFGGWILMTNCSESD
jgi:hypothetical protein